MDQMRALVDWLNLASKRYYVDNDPLASDAQWDERYDELLRLEKETGIRLSDSPTGRVGGEPLAAFKQHPHRGRLWSMDKVQSLSELWQWMDRVRALYEKTGLQAPLRFGMEYKYDGLTLNLSYEDGVLVQAATRGDGMIGEAVLPQAKTIRSIPLRIPYKGKLEIHGECIMRLSVLARYNQTAQETLKNARNAAAGALRNLDPEVTRSRRLDAFFYEVGDIEDAPFADQAGLHRFIVDNGFPASKQLWEGEDRDALAESINQVENEREKLDFLIDGVVIKITDRKIRDSLGYTDKFPRWAVAYKFAAQEATTRLENVVWEPGRTGKLTPLAHLSPVDFAGVRVNRATLNNYGDIVRKRLSIGCTVFVRRANDVIPEVMGRVDDGVEGIPIPKPETCPACGTALVENGAHLFCPNAQSCRPQVVARLQHYCSREGMDIESLSVKTLEMLYDRGLVRTPPDLYSLNRERLLLLPGFQDKKTDKLLDALKASLHCSLAAFLVAIGIPNVGRATAGDLAEHFKSLDHIRKASREELLEIPEIGEVVADSIIAFMQDQAGRELIDGLLASGVSPLAPQALKTGALSGLTLVVTGTLSGMSRSQAENRIRENGGTASQAVSRKTHYLVAGEAAGSKLQKAQALGVTVLTEEEFLRLIDKEG